MKLDGERISKAVAQVIDADEALVGGGVLTRGPGREVGLEVSRPNVIAVSAETFVGWYKAMVSAAAGDSQASSATEQLSSKAVALKHGALKRYVPRGADTTKRSFARDQVGDAHA